MMFIHSTRYSKKQWVLGEVGLDHDHLNLLGRTPKSYGNFVLSEIDLLWFLDFLTD